MHLEEHQKCTLQYCIVIFASHYCKEDYTRQIVLRAANKLSDDADMRLVENASFAYYQRALDTGAHIAYLVYEKYGFVAAEREMELPQMLPPKFMVCYQHGGKYEYEKTYDYCKR